MIIFMRLLQSKYRWFILILAFFVSSCSTYHNEDLTSSQGMHQARAQYAAIQHGRLEYYRFGHGSPIILISGYMTDVSSWDDDFLAALAQQHQVIVFNNRNVGGSSVPSDNYLSQDLADDTSQLIHYLNLKKTCCIRYLNGRHDSPTVSGAASSSISQLILINTAIAGKQALYPDPTIEKELLNMPASKLGRFTVAVRLFFPAGWHTQMAYALATHRFLPPDYTEMDAATVKPQQKNLVQHWVTDNQTALKIHAIHIPTLILNGEADIVLPPLNSVILSRTIPHSELIRWKEGGHAMIYQYPKEMATVINTFIAKTYR